MRILLTVENETLRYAAEELAKYLSMMDATVHAEIAVGGGIADAENAVVLGLLSELGRDASDVADAMIDDVIDARVDCLTGYVAGSNGRSVLMGVYEFFKSAGCRWVRPGEAGEYIPKRAMGRHSFSMRKKADHPFRGQCIEGAVSFEHVRDTILWLPRVNANLFMIEQIVPYNYMNRWYRHTDNVRTDLPPEPPYEDYCRMEEEWERLIKKCGLQLHTLGHGALNEPFGVRHMISGMHYDVPEETKKAFALVGGRRELFQSSPFFTQVCMSAEWVRERIVHWIADYLEEHPYVDFVHFWLGDNKNNHCECAACAELPPSDWYVMMLNRLDEILTERSNPAKIVFIMYVDTLWPPIRERLNNPSRFIMTTAAVRTPGDEYSGRRREGGIPAWKRNDYAIEKGFDLVLSFTDAWKPIFDGPKFLFEYVLYTKHFADPGYMSFSREMARDMKGLCVTGFDGVMSDQTQRSFFPTGLPASMVGEFLFDTSTDTETYIEGYMKDAFGADWQAAKDYLEQISRAFSPRAMEQNTDATSQDTGAEDASAQAAGVIGNASLRPSLEGIAKTADAFAPTVRKNRTLEDPCQRESWRILSYHTGYCKMLSEIYIALAKGEIAQARNKLDEMIGVLSYWEEEIHPYFDLVLFKQRTSQLIEGR